MLRAMRAFVSSLLLLALVGCADTTPPTWTGEALLEAPEVEATRVVLRWSEASDDTAVAGYRLLKDDVEVTTVSGDLREHAVEGLEDATEYRFTVEALDEAENGSEPLHVTVTTADGTPPGWPRGARLVATEETAAPGGEGAETEDAAAEPAVVATALEWAPAIDEGGVAGYRLEAGGEVVAELGADATTHRLEGAAPEGLTLVAFDEAGNDSSALPAMGPNDPMPEAPAAEEVATAEGAAEPRAVRDAPPMKLNPAVTERIQESLRRMPLKQIQPRLRLAPNVTPMTPTER
ncbi:MAG: hypothetical protein CMN29_28685 [Sandaracinus sp.]|nr:hypothetical protein [Sandaracinus sp.]